MGTVTEIEPTEEEYRDFLNEVYGTVSIAGMDYNTSWALEEVDPIAFRCGYNDYCSEHTQYQCDECGSAWDDERDAEECCMFECEACGTEHTTEAEAAECAMDCKADRMFDEED